MKWVKTEEMTDEAWKNRQKEGDKAKRRARRALKTAMVEQFNQMYGRDANDLASWQHLCIALGVEQAPRKVASCKRVRDLLLSLPQQFTCPRAQLLARTHVNLVDFLQAEDPEKPVRTFPSEDELSVYSHCHGKFFPRKHIKAGSLLRCLLRRIGDSFKSNRRYC